MGHFEIEKTSNIDKGDIFLKGSWVYGSEFPQPPPDINLSEVKEEKKALFSKLLTQCYNFWFGLNQNEVSQLIQKGRWLR